jgi:phage gp36-like protein
VSTPYATTADVQARYPKDAAMLCADETTRLPDWSRFDAALSDVSMEIRIILQGRYTAAQLGDLDEESLGALKVFAIDMAMYRVAVSFARSTERLEKNYENAVARLEGIAKGRGGLTFVSGAGAVDGESVSTSPGEAIVIAPERLFSRDTMRG